jgi:hypothetical protein
MLQVQQTKPQFLPQGIWCLTRPSPRTLSGGVVRLMSGGASRMCGLEPGCLQSLWAQVFLNELTLVGEAREGFEPDKRYGGP